MLGFAEDRTLDRYFLGVAKSVTGRAWRARLDARGEAIATAIAQRGIASETLARVLAGRGVSIEGAPEYLSPSLRQDLPDPSSLTDMDAAASRLADAVAKKELVAIFGDYDVDGATSAALLHGVLAALGLPPRIYIPDRIFEGYGPNPEAIDNLIDGGATLIVCVDCGSTSFEALRRAKDRGVDVVVLDHHQVGAELPPALAIVNPSRRDDISAQGQLAAVGVTFLTAVALLRELRRRNFASPLPDLLASLDLVALGTVCDMVPLAGLNRALVVKGLVALRRTERIGLRALVKASRLKSPPDCGHLGFLLGPRINAGGRIGEATLGARLLTATDPAEAEKIALTLDRLNSERQAIEAAAVAEAIAEADAEVGAGEGPPVFIAGREGWHPGVVGLVAARLKERFGRPAFAIAWNGGNTGTGSGRSIPGVDIGSAVRAAVDQGILIKGGGHAMAAGITLQRERLAALAGVSRGASRAAGSGGGGRSRYRDRCRHHRERRDRGVRRGSGTRRSLRKRQPRSRGGATGASRDLRRPRRQRPCSAEPCFRRRGNLEGDRLPLRRNAARPSPACGARAAASRRRNAQPRPLWRCCAAAASRHRRGAARRTILDVDADARGQMTGNLR